VTFRQLLLFGSLGFLVALRQTTWYEADEAEFLRSFSTSPLGWTLGYIAAIILPVFLLRIASRIASSRLEKVFWSAFILLYLPLEVFGPERIGISSAIVILVTAACAAVLGYASLKGNGGDPGKEFSEPE
jgi:hypothetical protein